MTNSQGDYLQGRVNLPELCSTDILRTLEWTASWAVDVKNYPRLSFPFSIYIQNGAPCNCSSYSALDCWRSRSIELGHWAVAMVMTLWSHGSGENGVLQRLPAACRVKWSRSTCPVCFLGLCVEMFFENEDKKRKLICWKDPKDLVHN